MQAFDKYVRLDYQPLFGKMSPHSSEDQRPDPGDGGNRAYKYVHSNGRYGLGNFNHHRINYLRIFIEHCFGRFLVRLVVFLSDDELIFLLLFETMISQTF